MSSNLAVCEQGHTQLCFDEAYENCPCCKALEERDDLQERVDSLEAVVDEKNATIQVLETALEEAQNK